MIIIYRDLLASIVKDTYINYFIWLVMLDIITGTLNGIFFVKKPSSRIGIKGLIKHFSIILFVLTVYTFLVMERLDTLSTMLVLSFIFMYLLSIIENINSMGGNIPEWITKKINYFQEKISKKGEDKNE